MWKRNIQVSAIFVKGFDDVFYCVRAQHRSKIVKEMRIKLIEETIVIDEKENLKNDVDIEPAKERMWFGTIEEYTASVKAKLDHYKQKCESWMLSWGTYL